MWMFLVLFLIQNIFINYLKISNGAIIQTHTIEIKKETSGNK